MDIVNEHFRPESLMKPKLVNIDPESVVEKSLHRAVTTLGGTTRKWSSPNHRGVPDRLVFMPKRIYAVELKRLNGTPTKLQLREVARLRGLGVNACFVYGLEGLSQFIEYIKGESQ